jgi:hypothetical protein
MAELAGLWIYRRFNPEFVTGNLTPQEDALTLAGAGDDVVLTLREGPGQPGLGVVEGTIEWPGGGLNLKGTVTLRERVGERTGYVGDPRIFFEMVGTGRPGTDTDGWEYRYHGHLTRPWANAGSNQRPMLVGSVMREKAHNGRPGRWAGQVFSFIAIAKELPPKFSVWGLGMVPWTYRSFHNEAQYPYLTTYPTTHSLILEESVFKLKNPTSTTLEGTIEWPSRGLDQRILVLDIRSPEIMPANETGDGISRAKIRHGQPPRFTFAGVGRPGTETDGWQYRFDGQLTRTWPLPAGAPANVPRLPALVGTVICEKAHGDSPAGAVCPFVAVNKGTLEGL